MHNPSPLEAIFFAALQKDSAEERAEYLNEACGGDALCRHDAFCRDGVCTPRAELGEPCDPTPGMLECFGYPRAHHCNRITARCEEIAVVAPRRADARRLSKALRDAGIQRLTRQPVQHVQQAQAVRPAGDACDNRLLMAKPALIVKNGLDVFEHRIATVIARSVLRDEAIALLFSGKLEDQPPQGYLCVRIKIRS